MKKFLIFTFTFFSLIPLTAFASPISMSLFQDGFSVLDKLFLVGLGIVLIGLIFLCIAYCKSVSRKEKPIDSPFDVYLEDDTQEDAVPDEDADIEEDDMEPQEDICETESNISEEISVKITEDSTPEETPVAEVLEEAPEEIPEEPTEELPEETLEEIVEETPEEAIVETPEEVTDPVQDEKPETIIYPKLILTNVVTNDFVILPLYPETTVGRKTDNDLVLSDVTISGLHCKILNEDGNIFVIDENSTNGTFVNDERISEKTPLHHGDKLTLGKQEFNISVNE